MALAERDRGAGRVRGVFDGASELISYRYLGCSSVATDRSHAVGRMRIRRDMRTDGGGLLTSPLAIAMLDTAGISIDGSYHAACTHIDVHLWDQGHNTIEVRIEGTVVREARTAVFTEARFVDPERPEQPIGMGTVDWAIVGPTPPGFVYRDPGPGVPDSVDLPPLTEAYDAVPTDGGYAIERLSSRVGTEVLHHGPILVTSEAAAIDAVHATGRSAVAIETSGLRLIKAGRRGPFSVKAAVVANTAASVICRTEMIDSGNDGALVATGFLRVLTTGSP